MANEITINASIAYDDDVVTESTSVTDLKVTLTTQKCFRTIQTIATSDTALKLGDIGTLGFMFLKNLDTVNFVSLKTAASGTIIGKLKAGETYGPIRVGSGITAPAMIADTAACRVEVFLTDS